MMVHQLTIYNFQSPPAGILSSTNAAREKRLKAEQEKIESERQRKAREIFKEQRHFFIERAFDENQDLRFAKDQADSSNQTRTLESRYSKSSNTDSAYHSSSNHGNSTRTGSRRSSQTEMTKSGHVAESRNQSERSSQTQRTHPHLNKDTVPIQDCIFRPTQSNDVKSANHLRIQKAKEILCLRKQFLKRRSSTPDQSQSARKDDIAESLHDRDATHGEYANVDTYMNSRNNQPGGEDYYENICSRDPRIEACDNVLPLTVENIALLRLRFHQQKDDQKLARIGRYVEEVNRERCIDASLQVLGPLPMNLSVGVNCTRRVSETDQDTLRRIQSRPLPDLPRIFHKVCNGGVSTKERGPGLSHLERVRGDGQEMCVQDLASPSNHAKTLRYGSLDRQRIACTRQDSYTDHHQGIPENSSQRRTQSQNKLLNKLAKSLPINLINKTEARQHKIADVTGHMTKKTHLVAMERERVQHLSSSDPRFQQLMKSLDTPQQATLV